MSTLLAPLILIPFSHAAIYATQCRPEKRKNLSCSFFASFAILSLCEQEVQIGVGGGGKSLKIFKRKIRGLTPF